MTTRQEAPAAAPGTIAPAPRRGGRPSRQEEARIRDRILDVATPLFLRHGYGATSIEAVAKAARISKRTFYHRFTDKSALFGAVVRRLIDGLRPPPAAALRLFTEGSTEEILLRLARLILQAALRSEALALHRIVLAEATRFPELAVVVNAEGNRQEAIRQIAELLERETRAGAFDLADPVFAAEQFLQLVVAAPQRRALGLGTPMTATELDGWAYDSVALFLNGCRRRGGETVAATERDVAR